MRKTTMAFKADELTAQRVAIQMHKGGMSQSDVLRVAVFLGLTQMEQGQMINLHRLAEISEYTQAALFALLETLAPEKESRVMREVDRRMEKFHMTL